MTPVTLCMLDTRTVSHFLKKQPAVTRRVVAVPITALCISAITQGELLFGLAKRPDATALHEAVREFLRRVDVLPWDAATSEVHGPVRAAMPSVGRVLAPPDLLLIGSHAMGVGAVLRSNVPAAVAAQGGASRQINHLQRLVSNPGAR